MCVYIYIYIHTYTHICMYVIVYIYVYTYVYTQGTHFCSAVCDVCVLLLLDYVSSCYLL